jgi:hypothetical protein
LISRARNNDVDVDPVKLVPLTEVVRALSERKDEAGMPTFPVVSVIPPPSPRERYKDHSMVVVVPTRGAVAPQVIESWFHLAFPMNQKRNGPLFAEGYEVGHAYNALIRGVLNHPYLKGWRYIFTMEDDNLPPFDAPVRLLETKEAGPEGDGSSAWDGVSGIYFTKDCNHSPMAYGDAAARLRGEPIDFRPIDLSAVDLTKCKGAECRGKLDGCGHVVEVNGIAQGCAIWDMSLFREIPDPWFETVVDKILVDGEFMHPREAEPLIQAKPDGDYQKICTQDLLFCFRALKKQKRFAVDMRVVVGHLDVLTGRIY